jgi:hypothetical protein
MFEFFMKHIHDRDKIRLWERFLDEFREHILIDQKNKYFYIKSLWHYTEGKVPAEKKDELIKLILDKIPNNEGEEVVRSGADTYREEGRDEGVVIGRDEGIVIGRDEGRDEGIVIGRNEGFSTGAQQKGVEIAKNMLKQDLDQKLISSVTGLSLRAISKLRR